MVGGHSGERLSQAGLGLAGFGGPHHQSHLPVGLAFRRAGLKEVGAVVDLVHSAYRGDSSRQGWTTEAHLLEGQRTDVAAVREVIEQLGSLLLLALLEDTLVGCCQLVHREATGAYFGMFAIRPGLQGNGLGGAVLAEAERTARAQWGVRSMRMTVIRQREGLIAWYRRRGYEPTGETEPFPYGDERFGVPLRDDLEFVVLEKPIA
jgi:ribosomal protein S18 acetylase RimI-like enzyme